MLGNSFEELFYSHFVGARSLKQKIIIIKKNERAGRGGARRDRRIGRGGATAGLWIAHETRRSEHPRDGVGSELVRTAIDALTLTGATVCGAVGGAALALTSPVWLAHRAVCRLRRGP